MRVGQKPWNVSAFSHHVWMRMSSPERPATFVPSSSVSTVSRWLWIRNAKGMIRLCGVVVSMMRGVAQSELDRTCLQERRGLRCQHARYHRLEELGQNGKHGLACATQEMDDQVTNDESAGLVFALQLLRDHCQDAIEARLARCGV